MGKYYNNRRICKNCGKNSLDNLSKKYCSEKCREEYKQKQLESSIEIDTGTYYDNFVDGKGY